LSGQIRYDPQGQLARITIDRVEKKNAFAGTMREELAFAIDRAQNDPEVRVVVLAGAGKTFCAGGDLDSLASLSQAEDLEGARKLLESGGRVVRAIRKLEKPVIAAVEGFAAGAGCSLAAACDVVIAAESARFALSFVKIGLVPDWGGTFFLPRRIGAARTFHMSSSGEPIEARTARDWGLVDELVGDAEIEKAVTERAERLASWSPTSLSFQKYLIGSGEIPELEDALAREIEAQLACFETDEFRQAMARRRNKQS